MWQHRLLKSIFSIKNFLKNEKFEINTWKHTLYTTWTIYMKKNDARQIKSWILTVSKIKWCQIWCMLDLLYKRIYTTFSMRDFLFFLYYIIVSLCFKMLVYILKFFFKLVLKKIKINTAQKYFFTPCILYLLYIYIYIYIYIYMYKRYKIHKVKKIYI